jgi:uncharacterized protein (DUF433 family)
MSSGRTIKASEIIRDIQSGMTEMDLMAKYQLSRERLQSVKQHLRDRREQRTAKIAKDIRSGLSDDQIMKRYSLSSRGLAAVLDKLVSRGLIEEAEIHARRNSLIVPIPIYEAPKYPEVEGRLHDITEKGVGVRGIKAVITEKKTLSILPNEFVNIDPIVFEAICRWSKRDDRGIWAAGFEITVISQKCLRSLRQLIQEATFGDDMEHASPAH